MAPAYLTLHNMILGFDCTQTGSCFCGRLKHPYRLFSVFHMIYYDKTMCGN